MATEDEAQNAPADHIGKLGVLTAGDAAPPEVIRTLPDGSKMRCVWNGQDWDCAEIPAGGG